MLTTSGSGRALHELLRALEAPPGEGIALGNWRWTVRQRLAAVRDVLVRETDQPDDGWLAARHGASLRERNSLVVRIGDLGRDVLEDVEVERVRSELMRLVADVGHHIQRIHDLAYDAVELELGGSE